MIMDGGLSHDGTEDHVCSLCSSEYSDDEGGVSGYFGIIAVDFCSWCYSSMSDMVDKCEQWEMVEIYENEYSSAMHNVLNSEQYRAMPNAISK